MGEGNHGCQSKLGGDKGLEIHRRRVTSGGWMGKLDRG